MDDSLSVRQFLGQLVGDAGFQCLFAHDGAAAADMVRKRCPDVLLTDLEMARMNGLELISHVRDLPGAVDLPIVVVTSRTQPKHRREAEQAGANAYFTKPFSEQELLG